MSDIENSTIFNEQSKLLISRKAKLEQDIEKLLKEFHNETGIQVSSIDIDKLYVHSMFQKSYILSNSIKITLDI